eukprot:365378-Chlamydomonas_euryale.AAC.4
MRCNRRHIQQHPIVEGSHTRQARGKSSGTWPWTCWSCASRSLRIPEQTGCVGRGSCRAVGRWKWSCSSRGAALDRKRSQSDCQSQTPAGQTRGQAAAACPWAAPGLALPSAPESSELSLPSHRSQA